MDAGTAFREALIAGSVADLRALWALVCPHLPQPKNDTEAEATMHHARTAALSIPLKLRAYSHRWLLDHGLPSGLPDMLRPRAERMYPVMVEAVGIAIKARSEASKPLAQAIAGAMSDAVSEMYADGVTDPVAIKRRMLEARERTRAS